MRHVLTPVWRWSTILALLVGLALAWRAAAADVGVRTWTSTNGDACRAKFLRFEGRAQVIVEREKDGKPLTLPIRNLSAPDREYLKELRAALANEGEGADEALAAAEPAQPAPVSAAEAPTPTAGKAGKAGEAATVGKAGKAGKAGEAATVGKAGKAGEAATVGKAGKGLAGVGFVAWFLTIVGVLALLTGAIWLPVIAFKQSRSWGALVLCGALAAPCLIGSIPIGIFVYRQRADQAVRISALIFGGGVLFWVIGLGLLFFAWR